MPSVTVILFMLFFDLCQIGETTRNCNFVKIFYKLQLWLQLHKN